MMNDDSMEDRINELLEAISQNDKYNGCVFEGPGIYFVIGNGNLWEISNDASCSPRGGWFPDIVTGPTQEEKDCLSSLMETLDFDQYFFSDIIDQYGEFDEDYVEEYFEENEDEDGIKTYKKIKRKVNSGSTPFASIDDLVSALIRYDLESDTLYYEWEGDFIEFHNNICETGEERGYFDNISNEQWINILENIDKHIVTAD